MGELLTRSFIWIALLGYVVAVILQTYRDDPAAARWAWTLGAATFVAHVVCAFQFYHGWSHSAALLETARQTRELTGFNNGSGLYLNYIFTVVWVLDCVWWWYTGHAQYKNRRWPSTLLHGFFLFMIINGAIVFGEGPVRWYGTVLIAMMLAAYAKGSRNLPKKDVP